MSRDGTGDLPIARSPVLRHIVHVILIYSSMYESDAAGWDRREVSGSTVRVSNARRYRDARAERRLRKEALGSRDV